MSDCLHCDLLLGVVEYQRTHPCDCEKGFTTCVSLKEVVEALGDIIGDQLASEGSWPHRDYFLRLIDERFKIRSEFMREQRAEGWPAFDFGD
jgi:hypothetical protein